MYLIAEFTWFFLYEEIVSWITPHPLLLSLCLFDLGREVWIMKEN